MRNRDLSVALIRGSYIYIPWTTNSNLIDPPMFELKL